LDLQGENYNRFFKFLIFKGFVSREKKNYDTVFKVQAKNLEER
jgi:hypothetical protein